MKRRTEQEMMKLLLDFAGADSRVRAVWLNGSRANPNAPRDRWQDFDVVYAVADYESFLAAPHWVDRFGERVMMQTRSDQEPEGADFSDWYIYLMQFSDGNRVDLTLVPLSQARESFLSDRMRVLLLDKDGLLPQVPPATDADYQVQKPDRKTFQNCCNEFLWVSTNVAKGIWRRELPYAQSMYHLYVREAFDQMAGWKIAQDHGFSVNPGKMGKWYQRFLSREDWAAVERTYPGGRSYGDLLAALLEMNGLFGRWGRELAGAWGYSYPEEEDLRIQRYLRSGGVQDGEV